MPTPTTKPDARQSSAGVSRLILVASKKYPRYSEADVIELRDGRLLLAVGRKDGASDFAAGTLIGMFSRDRGVTWDDAPHIIKAPYGNIVDLMSVSFCRTPRGIHLFYLGRGKDAKGDTQVYQMLSTNEGKTWSESQRVNHRPGYYVVNNARVVRTARGRMLVAAAYVERIDKDYDGQSVLVLYSDDDGVTWRESNVVSFDKPLMEPGVVECADGSVYMTIRTTTGVLYEARSRDGGATWGDLGPTKLPAPAAPSTVVRDPDAADLWMFWCSNAKAKWKDRSPQVFARSTDHGKTWSDPRTIEHHDKHGYGYISFTRVGASVLLTYYDWPDHGQGGFHMTSLRQRTIPLAWFRGQATAPVFTKRREPVLKRSESFEGDIVSANSGLLIDKDGWRLWYTTGSLGPQGERLKVCHATSADRGLTWIKSGVVLPIDDATAENVYHASAHRGGNTIALFTWRRSADRNGLYRFISLDNGETFTLDPEEPLIASHNGPPEEKERAGEGRISNDAFDLVHNRAGGFDCFAAVVRNEKRLIGRSTTDIDGVHFSPTEIVLEPDHALGDAPDTQFYGMQVFRYRDFYLGLLHTYHAGAQTIQPEWAWSHDGQSWARSRTPCIALGDEGSFDTRMILFGAVTMTDDELIWLYTGCDWRHDAHRKGDVASAIGRAVLPTRELDAWLDTLPQP